MRDEIIKHLDGWNEKVNGALSRNALRHLLGWYPDIDNPKSLGELLVEQIENGQSGTFESETVSESISEPALAPEHTPRPSSHSPEYVKKAITEVVEGHKVTAHAARILLMCGWDHSDRMHMMRKSPAEIRDFLEEISQTVQKFDDMHPNRKRFLQMIFDAYLRSC